MRIVSFVFTYLLLCVISCGLAHAGTQDVKGWRSATWGMKEQIIVKVFKDEIKRLPQKNGLVKRAQKPSMQRCISITYLLAAKDIKHTF